ncbi:SoxR reducing system RseC family protein [Kaarinaea lacus]
MLEEQATVVAVENDTILVEVQRQSACGQCAANKGCGTGVLQKVIGNKRNIFRVIGELPVKVGDNVIVGINENALVRGSLIIYAVPVVFIILFALLGETIAPQSMSINADYASMTGALVGLAVSILGLRWYNRKIRKNADYQAVLLRHANIITIQPEYKLLG